MDDQSDDLIPTKATLLGRLKNPRDQSSWQEFFDTYSRLIYGVARKAGMNDVEAQEVLQSTMDLVAQQMPAFQYDPAIGSFKGWLLHLTRLQIVSRSLKRRSASGRGGNEKVAVDRLWDTEWQTNMTAAAVANVKRRLDPQKYQIYDFCVNKKWSPEKIAPVFGVSAEEAREAVDSITQMIEAELKRLEREML